jgi:predicted nucleic acid-binding protein
VSYLLDTNVVSELRKGQRCNPSVAAWFADIPSGVDCLNPFGE